MSTYRNSKANILISGILTFIILPVSFFVLFFYVLNDVSWISEVIAFTIFLWSVGGLSFISFILVRVEINDVSLRVKSIFGTKVLLWNHISKIEFAPRLKYIFFEHTDGKDILLGSSLANLKQFHLQIEDYIKKAGKEDLIPENLKVHFEILRSL